MAEHDTRQALAAARKFIGDSGPWRTRAWTERAWTILELLDAALAAQPVACPCPPGVCRGGYPNQCRSVLAQYERSLSAPAPEPCSLCNALTVPRNATHYDAEDLAAASVRAKLMHKLIPVEAAPAPEPSAQAVAELPDEIRVPLHRLWADAGYLIGRAKTGDTDLAVHTIKALCDELERAIRAERAASPKPSAQGEPVAWRPNIKCTPEQNFNAGLPNQQTIDYWKNIGCGIEYAYAAPSTPPPAVVEAVPQPFGDLAGVSPCCGEYSTCHRPCTPRGRWQAHAEMETVPLPDEQIAAEAELNPLMTMEPRPGRFALFLAGARFAERAHGIAPKAAQP